MYKLRIFKDTQVAEDVFYLYFLINFNFVDFFPIQYIQYIFGYSNRRNTALLKQDLPAALTIKSNCHTS